MIADKSRPIPALGNLDAGVLQLGAFCREIVTFIEGELPVWRQRPEIAEVEDEPRLNQSLCLHLDTVSRHQFDSIRFVQEPIQGAGRNADIGAFPTKAITVQGRGYQDHEQLLPIECKRLPTPPDSRRSDLEYVHGKPGQRTGGIERFKRGLHGRENEHALMIAYVQEKSFNHWSSAINTRLAHLAKQGSDDGLWQPAESLTQEDSAANPATKRLTSRHRRPKPHCCSDSVVIHHLWVTMN